MSTASGRFVVRIPRGLHAELTRQARDEGVSLNQYVATLLAGAAGWRGAAPARMGLPGYMPDHGQERRADYLRSTPAERLAEAISLSRAATRLAGGELDVEAILRTLVAESVEFLVIAGFAVAVHGYPRATKGLEIVPRPEAPNLELLYGALAAIAARPVEPVEFGPGALALGGNWALQTEHGRADVMQQLPGAAAYDELDANAVAVDLVGVGTVRFAGYDDVVAMKTAAGRRQDDEDLVRLREARAEG